MKYWKQSKYRIGSIQLFLLLLGVAFIAVGITRGEAKTVLMKAIYICLECIGIG